MSLILYLLLAGIVVGMLYLVYLLRTKWMEPLSLVVTITGTICFLYFFSTFFYFDIPVFGKKIIELDKFETFSGKEGDGYYFTVLIKRPPENTDNLKRLMVQYFYKKTKQIKIFDPGSYLRSVRFYKKTKHTVYFINNDEHRTFFSDDYLDKYPEEKIGSISRKPCKGYPTKYQDVMYMYEEEGPYRETAEGLYSECGTTLKTSPKDASSNPDSIAMVFVEGEPAKCSDFYISKYEVTQGLWKSVMGRNPSDTLSYVNYYLQVKYGYGIGDNYPVYNVSWDDVQCFITALNAKTGKTYRLPTEAEWRYAASGGNKSKGYKYSGSNVVGAVAWYSENNRERPGNKGAFTYGTKPVGTKQANELGIHDMSGNVEEYTDSSTGEHLSLGGSWRNADFICSVSYSGNTWSGSNTSNGFRLARDP
ncbi:MAG: formylglycine-generating enzyme family protein [Candidatus Fibromonas sp.]|jgi:hypothetical protein|nr:formylglycine-generating enzyme family protein [Candidatus Fibromonas sp.]